MLDKDVVCYNTLMTKKCSQCLQELSLESFPTSGTRLVGGAPKTYHIGKCRECYNSSRRVSDRKTKKLFFDGEIKECSVCEQIKPISDFAQKNNTPSYRCKDCHNAWYKSYYLSNSTEMKRKVQKWKSENVTQWSRHGLSEEQFENLKKRFDNRCWICNTREGSYIDHDHNHCKGKTGCDKCVRGWLCHYCNAMLGFAKDNKETLARSIEYLTESIPSLL